MTKTCPDCQATVLSTDDMDYISPPGRNPKTYKATVHSTSQPERITDEMLNAHIKALGDWTEPFTAERESGVAMDMDISQEDADQFNADERARLRIGYTAALAATSAVDHADYKIGGWLSAALEDPNVCAAMKADINAWFEAHQPGLIMSMSSGTQGTLALYLNEVQPVDGRVQINVSIDELTVLRHLAAAVGGEREALAEAGLRHAEGLTAQLDKRDWKPTRAHIEQARNSIKKLADLVLAAQPASPLRGRQLQEIHAALFEPEESDAYDNLDGALIDIERLSEQDKPTDAVCIRTIRRVLTQLNAVHNVFSASPPEQPAAYPSAEADEAHADLLRRLATVPKEEKE